MTTDHPAAAPSAAESNLNLALIGNCAIGALVDRRGAIVWCCMPRFDGDPVFHALLDEGSTEGSMSVELEGLSSVEQTYEHGTAIVRTRLLDAEGRGVEVTDFAPRFFHRDRVFRPAQL